jgi:hypothetical protein
VASAHYWAVAIDTKTRVSHGHVGSDNPPKDKGQQRNH